jgi:hypothetical protein
VLLQEKPSFYAKSAISDKITHEEASVTSAFRQIWGILRLLTYHDVLDKISLTTNKKS